MYIYIYIEREREREIMLSAGPLQSRDPCGAAAALSLEHSIVSYRIV